MACFVGQEVRQHWPLLSSYGQKWMPGERGQEPVASWLPPVQGLSFPLSWSGCRPRGALPSSDLQKPDAHQLPLPWDAPFPPHPEQPALRLGHPGLAEYQGRRPWKASGLVACTRGLFWQISLLQGMGRVTNAPVLGTQSALLCCETDAPHFYRAFTCVLFFS